VSQDREEMLYAFEKRLNADLWKKLRYIVFEKGYLCYHDDAGCHFVLREIVEALKDYSMKKTSLVEE